MYVCMLVYKYIANDQVIKLAESIKPSEDQAHNHNLAVWNVTFKSNQSQGIAKVSSS